MIFMYVFVVCISLTFGRQMSVDDLSSAFFLKKTAESGWDWPLELVDTRVGDAECKKDGMYCCHHFEAALGLHLPFRGNGNGASVNTPVQYCLWPCWIADLYERVNCSLIKHINWSKRGVSVILVSGCRDQAFDHVGFDSVDLWKRDSLMKYPCKIMWAGLISPSYTVFSTCCAKSSVDFNGHLIMQTA